jgi:hypothetical protein
MSRPVSLPCPTCADGVHGTWSVSPVPGWAAVAGSAGVEWLDGSAADLPTAESAHFPRAQLPPRRGEERAVRVRAPFRSDGGPFWALFKPALAAINGLDEYPELLSQCAMIACTPVETLSRDARHAWLRVHVEDAIVAAEAADHFPPSVAGSLGYLVPELSSTTTMARAASGGLSYYAWSAEGDIGSWAVCTDGERGQALVLYGEWSFHQDDVALGHRPLSPAETAAIAAAWPVTGPEQRKPYSA